MCGLAGIVTKKGIELNQKELKVRAFIMRELLLKNELRGRCSTGIGLIGKNEVIIKRAQPATLFVEQDIVKRVLLYPWRIVIGHTRAPTMGDVTDANAHPFKEGIILGAHNGMISNHEDLDKTINVDSQAVIRELDKDNNDYKLAFSKVRGSCALTWINLKEPEYIYLVAHINSLSMARIKELNSIVWSSQSNHLKDVLNEAVGSNGYDSWDCLEDRAYRIDGNLQISHVDVNFKSYFYSNYYDGHKEEEEYARGSSQYEWNRNEYEYYMKIIHDRATKKISDIDKNDYSDQLVFKDSNFLNKDKETFFTRTDNSTENKIGQMKLLEDGRKNFKIKSFSYHDFNDEDWGLIIDRAFYEGCAICGGEIAYSAYYDSDDGSLLCSPCYHKNPEYRGMFDYLQL